jgi:hypothetical protein
MDVLTDELARAICALLAAQGEYDKADQQYDGRSWVWAGAEVIENLDNAKKQLKKAMDNYIDDRIAKATD